MMKALDIVLVKFQSSIDMGQVLPIVRLKSRGDIWVVDTALDIMEVEVLN